MKERPNKLRYYTKVGIALHTLPSLKVIGEYEEVDNGRNGLGERDFTTRVFRQRFEFCKSSEENVTILRAVQKVQKARSHRPSH